MKKTVWLPTAFVIYGTCFYIWQGVTMNAWKANLPLILSYVGIVVALTFALRKKEKMQDRYK